MAFGQNMLSIYPGVMLPSTSLTVVMPQVSHPAMRSFPVRSRHAVEWYMRMIPVEAG